MFTKSVTLHETMRQMHVNLKSSIVDDSDVETSKQFTCVNILNGFKRFICILILGLKLTLVAIYKLAQWHNIYIIGYVINGIRHERNFISTKRYKSILCWYEVVNLILTPFIIILLLRLYFFNTVYNNDSDHKYSSHKLQSWEFGLFSWFFFMAIYNFVAYVRPCYKYYDDTSELEYLLWWDKVCNDRKSLKLYVLMPFGIDLRKIKNVNATWMDWHIVLAALLPSVFVFYTSDFIMERNFYLKCGESDYYRYHAGHEKFGDEYCILVSSLGDQWFKYYLSQSLSSVVSIWGAIKILATIILKYGNETINFNCRYNNFCSCLTCQVGGKVDMMDEFDEIQSIKRAIVLLCDKENWDDTKREQFDQLLMSFQNSI